MISQAPHNVVTAFLWDGARILLVQRSDNVATFPGKWSAISGFIEGASATNWGLVEISQECSLPRRRLTIRGAAAPLLIDDARFGVFAVNPVLVEASDVSDLTLDWEAQQSKWVTPDQLLRHEQQAAVPGLFDVFEAIWPPRPAKDCLELNISAAQCWFQSGAAPSDDQLTPAIAAELLKITYLINPAENRRWKSTVNKIIQHLTSAIEEQPDLLTLGHSLTAELDSQQSLAGFQTTIAKWAAPFENP